MTTPGLVLSLRPRFAEAIVSGVKTVEVRRSFSDRWIGRRAALYASTPVRAILGTAVIADVQRLSAASLWRRHGPKTGLLRDELDAYLAGREIAFAVFVESVERFARPVEWEQIRAFDPAVRPPQSYCAVRAGSAWARALAGRAGRRAG